MSRTSETQSANPIARVFSRWFQRDMPAASTSTREITPRVVPAPRGMEAASNSANGAGAATEPAATPATPSSSVAPTPTAQQRTYTVQQGDSLSKIALHLYGDVTQWELLYEANRDRVGDPDRIYAGQVLTVPDAPLH